MYSTRICHCLLFLLCLSACSLPLPEDVQAAYVALPAVVDYNFHIKPILSDRCYSCHGPDEVARKGAFRLDIEDQAKGKAESETTPIVEGSISKSGVCARILSQDQEIMMPPPESKLILTAREKALILKWIDQGAEYKEHWSFIAPKAVSLPDPADEDWAVNNEVDLFIHKKLKKEGLSPSEMAGKERLLKRVFMDLTGLPPSIEQIDSFLRDGSELAFEKVVDQLLVSEACAERLALEWMDVARYADSHGMHADGWRNMWPWRDWVIQSFLANMPYNEFVTLQLAGDLIPNASRDQILATAFHRNHPMTAEGGAIDEEFRVEYVADRTNTTATALMGLTMECARCHDHKFDPISQKEYFEMTAFFNNVREVGMTGDDGNFGPLLQLAKPKTMELLSSLKAQMEAVSTDLANEKDSIRSLQNYVKKISSVNLEDGITGYFPFEQKKSRGKDGGMYFDKSSNCYSNGEPALVEGVHGKAVLLEKDYEEIYLKGLKDQDVEDAISVSLWIKTPQKQKGTQVLIGNAGHKNTFWRGWDFYLESDNTLSLRFIHSLPHNLIHIRTQDSVKPNTWTHVAFTYDGGASAKSARLFVSGVQQPVRVVYDKLYKNIRPIAVGLVDGRKDPENEIKQPLRVGKSYRSFTGDNGTFTGALDELRVYGKAISSLEVAILADRTNPMAEQSLLIDHAIRSASSIRSMEKERSNLIEKYVSINDTIGEIMVMEEMSVPRPTFVLDRGEYNAHKEQVTPSTPAKVLPYSKDLPKNRLGLAKWLFDPNHPLTSRATVNRYWQMVFGVGIVKTPQDFGNQGALPSHPELLDWLALELIESGWDIKALLKTMVMSATYQQSSIASSRQKELDPENVFLSRSSSYRWPAELIRDNALAASGLLVRKVGGPSVKPYQPDGLWIEKGTFSKALLRYKQDHGDNLYRRSLYTFIKRTSPNPAMTVFDAPNRDVCTVSREITNTPLQALVLLNDPQFVEAARVLGERMLRSDVNLERQITTGFRLATGRTPTNQELEILSGTYQSEFKKFRTNSESAREILAVGDHMRDPNLSESESAAMTIVANTILNLDESYTKR